jgi:hypothetical protein
MTLKAVRLLEKAVMPITNMVMLALFVFLPPGGQVVNQIRLN